MALLGRMGAVLSLAAIFAGCANVTSAGRIENLGTQEIGRNLPFENLDVNVINVTRDRYVTAGTNDYSTLLKPNEIWLVVNLDVTEKENRPTRLYWKKWLRVRAGDGTVLAPEFAILPVNEEILGNRREPIAILFRVRRNDFPVTLFDEERRFEKVVRG